MIPTDAAREILSSLPITDLVSLEQVITYKSPDDEWQLKLMKLGYSRVPLPQALYFIVGSPAIDTEDRLRMILLGGIPEHLEAYLARHPEHQKLLVDDRVVRRVRSEHITPRVRDIFKKEIRSADDIYTTKTLNDINLCVGATVDHFSEVGSSLMLSLIAELLTEDGIECSQLTNPSSNPSSYRYVFRTITHDFLDFYNYPPAEWWLGCISEADEGSLQHSKVFEDPKHGWRRYNDIEGLSKAAQEGYSGFDLTTYSLQLLPYLLLPSHPQPPSRGY